VSGRYVTWHIPANYRSLTPVGFGTVGGWYDWSHKLFHVRKEAWCDNVNT